MCNRRCIICFIFVPFNKGILWPIYNLQQGRLLDCADIEEKFKNNKGYNDGEPNR